MALKERQNVKKEKLKRKDDRGSICKYFGNIVLKTVPY